MEIVETATSPHSETEEIIENWTDYLAHLIEQLC